MSDNTTPEPGTNWRMDDLRISYRPEWDHSQSYVTYRAGTAGLHFSSLAMAQRHLAGESKRPWREVPG